MVLKFLWHASPEIRVRRTPVITLSTMALQSSKQSMKAWSTLTAVRHSFTTEQLQQFNAAGIDPYLIQVAQLIGSQFNISPQGQRNLANVFSSLPQIEFYAQRLGIGFSERHVARILSESDGGFAFLGIVGCLGEYFVEDFVVAVLMKLVNNLEDDVPDGFEPGDFQFKRLVRLCQGVLSTSPLGVMISRNHENLRSLTNHINVSQVVTGLINLNALATGAREKLTMTNTGSDAFWFAAVAEYLFNLTVVVQDIAGASIYATEPGAGVSTARLILQSGQPLIEEDFIDLNIPVPTLPWFGMEDADTTPILGSTWVSGGRVTWEKLFRSTFGRAFTDIDSSLVADFTGGAASLLSATLSYDQTNPQVFFLPQASTIRGLSGYGLVETVTSWFPELRRLAPQMGKAARLPFQQARDRCDEVSKILESGCMCNSCGNASSTSTEFCRHSVVETILDLGVFIARTVVIPNLFPKRSGILAFYQRLHAARVQYRTKEPPGTEEFFKGFAAALPSSRDMVEIMCMLFTGGVPSSITDTTMSISHDGICVSLNAWNPFSGARNPENEQQVTRQRAGVTVSSGSSHMYGRIFYRGYWVPAFKNQASENDSDTQRQAPLSFTESFELMRTRPREVKQIVRPRMGELMFSYVRVGHGEEERAKKMGWIVL